jgi:hypothetical protein
MTQTPAGLNSEWEVLTQTLKAGGSLGIDVRAETRTYPTAEFSRRPEGRTIRKNVPQG